MGIFKKSCLKNCNKIVKFANLKMGVPIFSRASCVLGGKSTSSLLLVNIRSAYFEMLIELSDHFRFWRKSTNISGRFASGLLASLHYAAIFIRR